jgi:hypothetical protein
MSHAALVNVGLFYVVVIQPLVLVIFVRAARRAPSGPPDSAHPAQETPAHEVPASQQAEPARLPARVPWPPADAVGSSGGTGYVGRHGAGGGPPWGPAPKPPGAAW